MGFQIDQSARPRDDRVIGWGFVQAETEKAAQRQESRLLQFPDAIQPLGATLHRDPCAHLP